MIATVSFESATVVKDRGEVWEVPIEVYILRIGSANRIPSGLGILKQESCYLYIQVSWILWILRS